MRYKCNISVPSSQYHKIKTKSVEKVFLNVASSALVSGASRLLDARLLQCPASYLEFLSPPCPISRLSCPAQTRQHQQPTTSFLPGREE